MAVATQAGAGCPDRACPPPLRLATGRHVAPYGRRARADRGADRPAGPGQHPLPAVPGARGVKRRAGRSGDRSRPGFSCGAGGSGVDRGPSCAAHGGGAAGSVDVDTCRGRVRRRSARARRAAPRACLAAQRATAGAHSAGRVRDARDIAARDRRARLVDDETAGPGPRVARAHRRRTGRAEANTPHTAPPAGSRPAAAAWRTPTDANAKIPDATVAGGTVAGGTVAGGTVAGGTSASATDATRKYAATKYADATVADA